MTTPPPKGAELPRPKFTSTLLALGLLIVLALLALGGPGSTATQSAVAASGIAPDHVSFDLEACRNNGDIDVIIDEDYAGTADHITCDPETAYIGANLGKNWSELDLVPHRLTTSLGTQAAATETYDVVLAGDYFNGGTKFGYDFITVPVVNEEQSDASCEISVENQIITSGVTGGTQDTISRTVTVTQDKGTECVIDYAMRLALGASQFSGASLQSYMFEATLGGSGKRTISLPVNEILPQSLAKDMTATRNADHAWNLTKGALPTSLSFGNVCDPAYASTKSVAITVTWTRLAASPSGDVTIVTNVYATNPASRVITVQVTDNIYEGTTASGTAIDTKTSDPVDVPAQTTQLILTHVAIETSSATSFNDVATATYTDKLTGILVPGSTTATASATVATGTTTDQSATITDSESITGSGLTFAVAAPSVGSFTGSPAYVAGAYTTGPVLWGSGVQNGSGAVTFNKTVKLDPAQVTSGTLSDTATLTGSNDASASASASVSISSTLSGSFKLTKTIPNVLTGSETASFTFTITGPNSYSETETLSFAAGETSKSVDLSGLEAGSYNVEEDTATGWAPRDDQQFTISASSCSPSATFANELAPASARAAKDTNPDGSESGWELILNGPGAPTGGEKITTTGAGFVNFQTVLQEGSYTITETGQTGWDQTGTTGDCSFTVSYPADADKVFSCTISNRQRGTIIVKKETDPDGDSQSFEFNPSWSVTNFFLTDGQSNQTGNLVPATYSVVETVPTGWDLTSATCNDSSPVSAIALGAGETVTCTFNNRKRGKAKVIKTVSGGALTGSQSFTFQLRSGASNTAQGTILETLTATAANSTLNFVTNLAPGTTYQMCEAAVAGWMTSLGPPTYSPYNPASDQGYLCVDFTVTAGQTKTFTIDNTPPPGGSAATIGFWKNHASCASSNGKQKGVLDTTLEKFPIASGQSKPGIYFGALYVDTCPEAVALLNKSTLNGKKMASDPLFNMAAQLMAADLNIQAGAATCVIVSNTISAAHALLVKYVFTGNGYTGKLSVADATSANNLAKTLDAYNNNDGVC